jgi:hypothetical protein
VHPKVGLLGGGAAFFAANFTAGYLFLGQRDRGREEGVGQYLVGCWAERGVSAEELPEQALKRIIIYYFY